MASREKFNELVDELRKHYPPSEVETAQVQEEDTQEEGMNEIKGTRLRLGKINHGVNKPVAEIWAYADTYSAAGVKVHLRAKRLNGAKGPFTSEWDCNSIINPKRQSRSLNDPAFQKLKKNEVEAMCLYYFFSKNIIGFDDIEFKAEMLMKTLGHVVQRAQHETQRPQSQPPKSAKHAPSSGISLLRQTNNRVTTGDNAVVLEDSRSTDSELDSDPDPVRSVQKRKRRLSNIAEVSEGEIMLRQFQEAAMTRPHHAKQKAVVRHTAPEAVFPIKARQSKDEDSNEHLSDDNDVISGGIDRYNEVAPNVSVQSHGHRINSPWTTQRQRSSEHEAYPPHRTPVQKTTDGQPSPSRTLPRQQTAEDSELTTGASEPSLNRQKSPHPVVRAFQTQWEPYQSFRIRRMEKDNETHSLELKIQDHKVMEDEVRRHISEKQNKNSELEEQRSIIEQEIAKNIGEIAEMEGQISDGKEGMAENLEALQHIRDEVTELGQKEVEALAEVQSLLHSMSKEECDELGKISGISYEIIHMRPALNIKRPAQGEKT